MGTEYSMDDKLLLPPLATLSGLPESEHIRVLNLLFEPSSTIHALLLPCIQANTFSSYDAFIDLCHEELANLVSNPSPGANAILFDILGSHPRLGAKKIESVQSRAEQAHLHEDTDCGGQLAALNAEYEARFPGLRYVVFVNGRSRPEIMSDMRWRIERGDFNVEKEAAIQVCIPNKPFLKIPPLTVMPGHLRYSKEQGQKVTSSEKVTWVRSTEYGAQAAWNCPCFCHHVTPLS